MFWCLSITVVKRLLRLSKIKWIVHLQKKKLEREGESSALPVNPDLLTIQRMHICSDRVVARSASIMSFRSNQNEKPSFFCWLLSFLLHFISCVSILASPSAPSDRRTHFPFTSRTKAHQQEGSWGLKQGLWLLWDPWSLLLAAHATISTCWPQLVCSEHPKQQHSIHISNQY